MADILDVVVVGAGPGGIAAALTAAAHGCSVLCVDKATFPRDKTCGDGLTTNALRQLEALGLTRAEFDAIGSRGRARDRARLAERPARHAAAAARRPARRRRDRGAISTPRWSRLARRRGVDVRESCAVEKLAVHAGDIELILGDGTPVTARHVIAADGHWSTVRRALEPDSPRDLGEWHAVRQYFDGVNDDRLWVLFERDLLPGYAWVFPLPGGAANVGYGVLRSDRRSGRDLKELWPELLARPALRAVLGDATPAEPVRAWPIPTRYDPARLTNGRVLFVGDAAGVVDPLTGEGIAQAIETGALAAEAIATRRRSGAGVEALSQVGRVGDRPRSALRRDAAGPDADAARRPGRDRGGRAHALDPPQLRPVDVRGLPPCTDRHAGSLAARRVHGARRVPHAMMPAHQRRRRPSSPGRMGARNGASEVRGFDQPRTRRHLEGRAQFRWPHRLHAGCRDLHRRR